MSGVFANMGEPESGGGDEDYEKIQGTVEKLPINPDTGEIDYDSYKPFWTKADERIKGINLWLEDNASWMKVVFGMVPSLTWMFAINFYIWLFLLVFLVLNAESTFAMLPFGESKMDLVFVRVGWTNLFGFVLFGVIVVLKYIVVIANIILGLFDVLWNVVIPAGFAIAVALAALFWLGFAASIPICLRIVATIKVKMDERKKARDAEKEKVNREVLENITKSAIGN